MDYPQAQKALNQAKLAMFTKPDFVFFATICFGLRHIWDESVKTAETDGMTIWYNPNFFMRHSTDEQFFILLHELGHVFLKHMLRIGDRDHERWVEACDHVINLMWQARGIKVIPGSLCDPKYKGMSTEQVYDLLPTTPPACSHPNPMGNDLVPPQGEPEEGSGSPSPSPGNGSKGMTIQEKETAIDNLLIQARMKSQMAGDKPGTIPGDIELYLDSLLKPKLPLKTLLRRFMTARQKTDYNWKKPNRRFFPNHLLPSLDGEALAHIAFVVDLSGSMSDSDCHRVISEIYGVMKALRPKKLTLVQFDTRIRHVDELYTASDIKNVKFSGRGGTDIRPVMDWIEENKPTACVLMTDGEFYPDNRKIKTPLMWMIHDNPRFTAKYGRVVNYTMNDL